jgi:hypothetical protein
MLGADTRHRRAVPDVQAGAGEVVPERIPVDMRRACVCRGEGYAKREEAMWNVSDKLPLQYVPVFGQRYFVSPDGETSLSMSRTDLARQLADHHTDQKVVWRIGEIYDKAGTAQAQITRKRHRASQYDSHVRVVDLNGCARVGVQQLSASLEDQLKEAERLMLYYANQYDELKRAIENTVGAEMGALFAKAGT